MPEFFVVDLERHNDGEDGLVGPFDSRPDAERFIEAIDDEYIRKYATVRPVVAVAGTDQETNHA